MCIRDRAKSVFIENAPDFPIYIAKGNEEDKRKLFLEAFDTISKYYLDTDRDIHLNEMFWYSLFCVDTVSYTHLDVYKRQGGPPCPPYSQTRHYLVNKKNGFEDEKAGFAVPEYFRAIEELNPKVFVFENVDGFMFKTHEEPLNFLKEESERLGYKVVYKVINSANYGVPQKRKRFICVGVKNNLPDFKFPEETHEDPEKLVSKLPWVTCGDVLAEFDNITEEEKEQRPGTKHYELLKDIPPGDNYLFYTEKRGHSKDVYKRQGKRYVNHRDSGNNILLFVRENKSEDGVTDVYKRQDRKCRSTRSIKIRIETKNVQDIQKHYLLVEVLDPLK